MTSGKPQPFLIDTNIVIGLINKDDYIENRIQSLSFILNSVVVGELYFGVFRSARQAENLMKLEAFVAQYRVMACTKATSLQYGKIRQQLLAKGRPIPDNDIWIAALALQHGLTLVTRDAHFRHVDDLIVQAW
jgi:tRNA(fMet)-specific endonuclease VapC